VSRRQRDAYAFVAIRYGAFLVVVWLLLWDEVTLGTVLAGLVVAAALLAAFPVGRSHRLIAAFTHPVVAARFAWLFVRQLVTSNIQVTRMILRRHPDAVTAVVGVPLRTADPAVVAFVAHITALTPGTTPIDVSLDPPTLYVHLLDQRDADRARRDVTKLEEMAVRALGATP
jgi:multicomponent Na+:H+ antiporter subunit E